MTPEPVPAVAIHVGTHFSPYGADHDRWDCRTCTHAIGYDGVHLWCQRHRVVRGGPCGSWEREAGVD